MELNKHSVEQLNELLSLPKKVVITMHIRPDGDAMGSSLGWGRFLSLLGHQVTVISPTDIDFYLMWLAGAEEILTFPKNKETAEKAIKDAELVFCLDYSALKRVVPADEAISLSSAKKILIDHHLDPEPVFDLDFHSVKASSTSELVFHLIEALRKTDLIDAPAAECLYTGIMTDTGSFQYSNTTAEVHRIAAELMKSGVDAGKIHSLIYNNYSENRLRFLGYCLDQKMKVIPEYNTAYIIISAAEIRKFHLKGGDTEGLVNYNLTMKDINFGVLIKEADGLVKFSFRSLGKFPCNEFAAHFGGGGHHNASGGMSKESLEETEKKFLALLPAYKDALNY